jgi:membrane protein YdbS with pleckstrin-like domain
VNPIDEPEKEPEPQRSWSHKPEPSVESGDEISGDEISGGVIESGFQKRHPNSVTVDRISSFIFAAVVGIGLVVGLAIVAVSNRGVGTVWFSLLFAGILLTIMLTWLAVYWPKWDYDRTSWRLSETGLEIRGGVIWRHRISIPTARVQHADVSQGPLQRKYGLGSLTVHTAGTQNASVALDGLLHETALELRDKVVRHRKQTDVV